MPAIKVTTNAKQYIKKLKKTHGALSVVSAHTVNTAAEVINKRYMKELDKFTIRNKYTKGAVKIYKAKPQRSNGDFRKIKDINAVVGIKKQKGKDHYLKDQEFGATKRGGAKTKGNVAVPLDGARTSGSHGKSIKGPLRLQKSTPQTLQIAGQNLGINDNFGAKGGAQRWAIMNKYVNGRGVNANKYGLKQAAKKQFFFQGMRSGLGVFVKGTKNRISMVRSLKNKTVRTKATHKFDKSVDALTPQMMETIFVRNAKKYMGK